MSCVLCWCWIACRECHVKLQHSAAVTERHRAAASAHAHAPDDRNHYVSKETDARSLRTPFCTGLHRGPAHRSAWSVDAPWIESSCKLTKRHNSIQSCAYFSVLGLVHNVLHVTVSKSLGCYSYNTLYFVRDSEDIAKYLRGTSVHLSSQFCWKLLLKCTAECIGGKLKCTFYVCRVFKKYL